MKNERLQSAEPEECQKECELVTEKMERSLDAETLEEESVKEKKDEKSEKAEDEFVPEESETKGECKTEEQSESEDGFKVEKESRKEESKETAEEALEEIVKEEQGGIEGKPAGKKDWEESFAQAVQEMGKNAREQAFYVMKEKLEQQQEELKKIKQEKKMLISELSEMQSAYAYSETLDMAEQQEKRQKKVSVKMFPIFSGWSAGILIVLILLNLIIPKEFYSPRVIWCAFLTAFAGAILLIAHDFVIRKIVERTMIYLIVELWFLYGVFSLLSYIQSARFKSSVFIFSSVIWLILLLTLRIKPLGRKSKKTDKICMHVFVSSVCVWYLMHSVRIIRMILSMEWKIRILGCLYLLSAIFVMYHLFVITYIRKEYLVEAVQNGRRRLKLLTYVFLEYHVLFCLLYILLNYLL